MSATTKLLKARNKPTLESKNLIIFAHIPKTAGSTINDIIDCNYNHIFNFYPRRNPKSTTLKNWIDDFNKGMISLREDSNPKILRGHFGIGIHDLLGVNHCKYITVLRDPIDRVISHYYFLDQVENFFKDSSSDLAKEKMNLEKFVYQRKDILVDNLQTRFLSGLGWHRSIYKDTWQETYKKNFRLSYGNCTDAMLISAKENLKNHIIFGVQSRFNESLELFRNVLGWQNVNFTTKKNVNKKKPKREELDPNLIKFIERENYLDRELYNYALEIFDNQLKHLPLTNKIIDSKTLWSYPPIPKQTNNLNLSMNIQLQEVSQIQLQEADLLLEQGQYTQAINKYKAICQANPENIPTLQKLAKAYTQNNSDNQAIKVYEQIIKLNPNRDKAYANLARLQAKQGNHTLAVTNFKKAISFKCDQPDWVFIGLAESLKKQ